VGGESTRPGALPVTPEEEQSRVLPVVKELVSHGVTVSIDTMHADTARRAVDAGALLVNDVSAGLADPNMLRTVAELGCQIVLGHLRGTPATMERFSRYDHPISDVVSELRLRAEEAEREGIQAEQVVLDPGIGFAKTPEHSWAVIQNLATLKALGYPLMIGVSRKRLLSTLLPRDATIADRDLPTSVLSALLAGAGANALRVHNVRDSAIAL
ncbi:dihydropteroate synthase, partial [Streptomyces sp. NPDC127092]